MDTYKLVAPEQLALRIRMIMGGRKLSRRRLASQIGMSRPSLTSKLDGKVPFTYDELTRVVAAIQVCPRELLLDSFDDEEVVGGSRPIRLRDFAPHPHRSL